MFPVMLQVAGRSCLVVGGGGVALRKAQALVAEGAKVTVVAPEVVAPLEEMAARGELEIERRPYRPGEAAGHRLVLAATDDREVNRRVFDDGEAAGVWVNVADDPELCAFHLPGRVRRGSLEIDISSGGNAPFAVRRLRSLFEARLEPEWSEWMEAAARFRRMVLASGLDRAAQEAAFDRFMERTVDGETLRIRVPGDEEMASWIGSGPSREGAAPTGSPEPCGPERDGKGFVTLVGAGPGCPGLLTVRGRRRLMEADAVVFDRLATGALPTDLPPETELHPVGKTAGRHPVPQEEIVALLLRLAREGRKVVRLKGGDPYIFGRGAEEAAVLASAGVPFEVVPGVTSGIGGLAWAGIPATNRREAVRVTLLTAHECSKPEGSQVRWDLLARDPAATLVGYMGLTVLPDVVARLLEEGMDPATPAAVVERAATSAQRRVVATLSGLPEAVAAAGLRPPALFVIGPTVRHAEELDWFARRPLAGQRLAVMARHRELVEALEDGGAEVVVLPLPVTPAARLVAACRPLTGCVLLDPAEVEVMDEERQAGAWGDDPVAWCVGEPAAQRARDLGWPRVWSLSVEVGCERLVDEIAAR